jgi:hypothetical protein
MPTKNPRISVTKDAALEEALSRARPLMSGATDATIVHDLAIVGLRVLIDDERQGRGSTGRKLGATTHEDPEFDKETLPTVRQAAWRV